MARFQTWDAFDLRLVDFHEQREGAAGGYLDVGSFTIGGVTYPQDLYLQYPGTDVNWEIDYFGSGMTLSNGAIVSGTVNAVYQFFNDPPETQWVYDLEWKGFAISAAALDKAMLSETRTDDQVLISQMLGGSDTIIMSAYSDYMEGRNGRDTMSGGGGQDTLLGGNGADQITGGIGNDTLIGGTDAYRDVFVFASASGHDKITDFQDGVDRIEFTSGPTSFAQLHLSQSGVDVLVQFGTSSVLIEPATLASLTAADFLFT